MGNRAVISFDENDNATGVYLHWNGGPESVLAFLAAAKVLGVRNGSDKPYFFARFCQLVGNFFGGTTSVGIGPVRSLDTDNFDNGWYILNDDLTIKERRFSRGDSIMRVEDLAPEDVLRYEGIKDECIEVNRELFKE